MRKYKVAPTIDTGLKTLSVILSVTQVMASMTTSKSPKYLIN